MCALPSILTLSNAEIASSLNKGDRTMLGKAITLVESKNQEHAKKADELLSYLLNSKSDNTLRIAISGSPGVGKSTFIEALGMLLVEKGIKVAVLSIDPSSELNKGSILGDKTRMDKLSIHPNAFIRPSPASGFLGGIAWRTREAIILCEASGYDIVIIETVGVGQSEHKVREMVDCFLLLLLPGAGDELQAIKKGIVEIADILAINKSDGDLVSLAKRTQKEYQQALHLASMKNSKWVPKTICTSSTIGTGIEKAWEIILEYQTITKQNGFLESNRRAQNESWYKERIVQGIEQYLTQASNSPLLSAIKKGIEENKINPIEGANQALHIILKK